MAQRSYKATGINLKAMAMGESDRLVTVLTREYGLVRAIAPGARKHKSKLAGRSGLFVINDLLFIKGKSIDKLVQAETQRSFPGLSQDLAKLTASQYLAEITLAQALSGQPQEELYCLLNEHLSRLEAANRANILACLSQAIFHLLALAGLAPEVFRCCLSQVPLEADLNQADGRVGFSVCAGGAIALSEVSRMEQEQFAQRLQKIRQYQAQTEPQTHPPAETGWETARLGQPASVPPAPASVWCDRHPAHHPQVNNPLVNPQTDRSGAASDRRFQTGLKAQIAKDVAQQLGLVAHLSAAELALMQQLSKPDLILTAAHSPGRHPDSKSGTIEELQALDPYQPNLPASEPHRMWRRIEKALRHYAQYQLDCPLRSAALIDTCFTVT